MEVSKGLIRDILQEHFPQRIRERGKGIHAEGGRIRFLEGSGPGGMRFEVIGTKPYNVFLRFHEDSFESGCDCPYDKNCKHIAAVLFQLEERDGRSAPDPASANENGKKEQEKEAELPEKRKASEPKKVQSAFHLDKDALVEENGIPSFFTIPRWPEKMEFDVQENGVLRVSLRVRSLDTSPSGTVSFWFEAPDILTACNCDTRVFKFCDHQIEVLAYIAAYLEAPGFFMLMDPEHQEIRKKMLMEQYRISEEKRFQELFQLGVSKDGVDLLPTDEGKGLWCPGGEEEEREGPPGLDSDPATELPGTLEKEDLEGTRRAGFVLWTDGHPDPLFNGLWLEPVSGELTKRGKLSKRIDPLFRDRSRIHIEDAEQELINRSGALDPERIVPLLGMDRHGPKEPDEQGWLERQKTFFRNFKELTPSLLKVDHLFIPKGEAAPPFSRQDIQTVSLAERPVKPSFEFEWEGSCYVLRFFLINKELTLYPANEELEHFHFFLVKKHDTLYRIDALKSAMTVRYFMEKPEHRVFPDHLNRFFRNFIDPLSEQYHVEIKDMEEEEVPSEPVSKKLYLSEFDKFILFRPVVRYDNGMEANLLHEGDPVERNEEDGSVRRYQRDEEYENEFLELMRELHFRFKEQRHPDFFHLEFEEMTKGLWFFQAFEKLEEHGVEVHGLKDLKRFNYSTKRPSTNIQVHSGEDWFDVNIDVSFGDEEVSLEELRKAAIDRNKYVKLGDGTVGILPEDWLAELRKYFRNGEEEDGSLKIPKQRFNSVEELFEEHADEGVLEEIREKRRKLAEFEGIKNYQPPRELRAELRDYQKEGYKWMRFLAEFGWGGILADDMGLGKTLQVLAFLRHRKKQSSRSSLVVVPTTLIFNWKKEAEKFTPDLEIRFHHGPSRSKDAKDLKDSDLVVTSYGTLMNDIELFREYKFDTLVLDESQAIKNPSSKRFKAVRLLRGKYRFTLTGTPIENNTLDLYAQMDFANPGMLGPLNRFKEEYALPVDRDKDPERAEELRKLVRPFILRRTKEQVIEELPEKTEDHFFCEMEAEQRKVYDAVRKRYRDQLLNKIEADGLEKSKVQVLEGLTKLRQVCDSPAILSEEGDYGADSVKLRELMQQVKEKTNEHKLLVFSQFVSMLQLIADELEKEGIPYEYLDGQRSVKERKASVKRFQEEAHDRVFLISLKAGGQGLDLTAADYVFLVDPWWNPAVEDQAIDRCYRIGQDKKVIAYRMVCKDSIEEKILRYQDRKKELASDLIHTEESIMRSLGKEDVVELFS